MHKIEFWVAFLATMLGVLAAFSLNEQSQQRYLNEITAQKLHLVFLESEFNGTTSHDALKKYSENNINTIFVKRTDPSLALAAIQDKNIVSFLPPYKLSLLISYIEAQKTLNQSLDIHKDYCLKSAKNLETKQNLIQNIKKNSASATTMSYLLQQQLKEYFDKTIYNRKKILDLEAKVKEIKKKILEGKINLSKE